MKNKPINDIREMLEHKVEQYNKPAFIAEDPISLPHLFQKRADIEIAGLFAATIAWGNRKSIIKSGTSLLERMDQAPHDFVANASRQDLKRLEKFVHRTFNAQDALDFVLALRKVYRRHESLEELFLQKGNAMEKIIFFRQVFVKGFTNQHAFKHVSDPASGSAAKRLNMYLRWMVRNDKKGVDFGLWKKIRPAELMLPLDVHTGNTARKLGLLQRKQDDAKAVEEITAVLRAFDPKDPVKYDFALFGLGVYEKF